MPAGSGLGASSHRGLGLLPSLRPRPLKRPLSGIGHAADSGGWVSWNLQNGLIRTGGLVALQWTAHLTSLRQLSHPRQLDIDQNFAFARRPEMFSLYSGFVLVAYLLYEMVCKKMRRSLEAITAIYAQTKRLNTRFARQLLDNLCGLGFIVRAESKARPTR